MTQSSAFLYFHHLDKNSNAGNERLKSAASSAPLGYSQSCDRSVFEAGSYSVMIRTGQQDLLIPIECFPKCFTVTLISQQCNLYFKDPSNPNWKTVQMKFSPGGTTTYLKPMGIEYARILHQTPARIMLSILILHNALETYCIQVTFQ